MTKWRAKGNFENDLLTHHMTLFLYQINLKLGLIYLHKRRTEHTVCHTNGILALWSVDFS